MYFGGQQLSFWKVKITSMREVGTIAAQSLLLHIIFAQVWYETGQRRKVIRFSCKSWRFSGYLNTSWRSVLDFERRQLRLPIILWNDIDTQLLHGKGIKRRLLVYPSDCNGRHMCLVLMWEIIKADRYENPVVFLEISAAINLNKGSGPINHEVITNSISLAQSRLRICA